MCRVMFTPEHEAKSRDMTPASVVGKRPPALSFSDIMVENLSTVLSEESRASFGKKFGYQVWT